MPRFKIGDRAHFFKFSFVDGKLPKEIYEGKVGIVIETGFVNGMSTVRIAYADGPVKNINGPAKYAVLEEEIK